MQLTGLALPRTWKARRKTPRFLVPTLPGYQPDSLDSVKPWRRRRRYIALGFAAFFYGFLYALLPPAFLSVLLTPLVVLAAVIVWALPVGETKPPRLIAFLFWAFWLSFMLWPNYLAIALPGLPWITVNRLFGGPLMLLLLVAASSSKPFRTEMGEILSATPWLWKMVVAFAISGLISTFFSSQIFTTLNKFVNLQIVWTSVFFASVWLFRVPGRITRWAQFFLLMAIATSILGLFEAHYQRILWADSIPSFLKVEDPAVQRLLAGIYRFEQYRISATTMSPLTFAEYLAMSTPFLIHFLLSSRRLVSWLALVAADALIFVAILNTDSRLGMVGFFFSHGILGLLYAARQWRRSPTSIMGPALTLSYPALLTVFVGAIFVVGRLRVLVLGDGSGGVSNNARELQFDAMWPVLFKSPLFGYGTGQGPNKLGFTGGGGSVLTIDSYLISIALDFGILGFILFYGLIFSGIIKSSKIALVSKDEESLMAIPIAVCLGVFLLTKFVLSQEANVTIMFMMLGAITALAWRTSPASVAGTAHSRTGLVRTLTTLPSGKPGLVVGQ